MNEKFNKFLNNLIEKYFEKKGYFPKALIEFLKSNPDAGVRISAGERGLFDWQEWCSTHLQEKKVADQLDGAHWMNLGEHLAYLSQKEAIK